MRKHRLIPLLALGFLTGATTAHAAVPVAADGSLRPRDGAELLEAVAQTGRPGGPVKIFLAEGQYVVGRTVDLSRPGIELVGQGAGRVVIRGTAAANTLLRVAGRSSVSSVSLFPAEDAADGDYALVDVRGGAVLRDAVVSVPDSLTSVSGIDAEDAALQSIEVESYAAAPAIHSSGSLDLSGGSSVYGGDPTLDLDAGGLVSTSTISRALLIGGPGSDAVVRVHTAAASAAVQLRETIIRSGDAEAPALIDVEGAATPLGSITLDAQRTTLDGTPEGTGVRIATGAELRPTVVTLGGLLVLASQTAIGCDGNALFPPVVTVAGIYRSGSLAASGGCVIAETGLRTGGDPSLTTSQGLRYGSPAIDALPRPPLVTEDGFGRQRTSTGPSTPTLTPTDLGALEYQYVPPSLEEVSAELVDDQGTVRFSALVNDGNDEEIEQLQVVWQFPDGTSATGTEVERRFPSTAPGEVTVTVTDPSGLRASRTVRPTASLTPADSLPGPTPTPIASPEPSPSPVADPAPTPAPPQPTQPQQTLPELVELPKRPGGQAPFATDSDTVRTITRLSARLRAKATRASGFGKAREGEAGVSLELATASNLTVIARRRSGTRFVTVPNARFSIDVSGGLARLHLTSRFGGATLRPGLYRVTVLVRPSSGTNARRDLYVRVLR